MKSSSKGLYCLFADFEQHIMCHMPTLILCQSCCADFCRKSTAVWLQAAEEHIPGLSPALRKRCDLQLLRAFKLDVEKLEQLRPLHPITLQAKDFLAQYNWTFEHPRLEGSEIALFQWQDPACAMQHAIHCIYIELMVSLPQFSFGSRDADTHFATALSEQPVSNTSFSRHAWHNACIRRLQQAVLKALTFRSICSITACSAEAAVLLHQ